MECGLSELLDSSFMENNTFEPLDVGYNFPTPPYEFEMSSPEVMTGSDSSTAMVSPLSSLQDDVEDDIFGELFAVNADDVFDVDHQIAPEVGQQFEPTDFPEDFDLLECIGKDLDDNALDAELENCVADLQLPCGDESKLSAAPVNENANKSWTVGATATEPPLPRVILRATTTHNQPHNDEQVSVIRMEKVSQYRQSAFKSLPRRTKGGKTVPAALAQPSHTARPHKKKFDLDAVDIRKVPPSRKAAVQAKINREKKKAYIESLEQDKYHLAKENKILKERSEQLEKERDELAEEAAYLRRVLFNDSHLAGLLNNIGNAPNVKLSVKDAPVTSAAAHASRKRKVSVNFDHDYSSKCSKQTVSAAPGMSGVCLHVQQDDVTVEFCRHCAQSASSS